MSRRSPKHRKVATIYLDEVDASRVTVGWILRELEARHWITRSGTAYEVTPLGEWISYEFNRLIGVAEAEQRFRDTSEI